MRGELPDGAEVHLLRTLGETGQLQILVHTSAKSGAHQWVFSKQKVEKTVWKPTLSPSQPQVTGALRSTKTGEPMSRAEGKASRSSCRASGLLELVPRSDPRDAMFLGLTPAKRRNNLFLGLTPRDPRDAMFRVLNPPRNVRNNLFPRSDPRDVDPRNDPREK